MDEIVVKSDKQRGHEQHPPVNTKAGGDDKQENFAGGFDQVFGRMKAHGREPVEFLRAVMNGVEGPNRAGVKNAVAEVDQTVTYDEKNKELHHKVNPREVGIMPAAFGQNAKNSRED